MSDMAIRPAVLKPMGPGNFRPMGKRPAAPWGQQTLFDKKRMGQKKMAGSFSAKELPTSLAFAAGSAGAIVLGAKMSSPWNAVLIGAGLMGIGYSIYNLFSQDEGARGVISDDDARKLSSKEAFSGVVGAFKSPRMYEQVDPPGPNWLFTANYFDVDVVFTVTNPSSEWVDLTLRFTQNEKANRGGIPLTAQFGESKDLATYFQSVRLAPHTSKDVAFQIDTLNWTGQLTETIVAEKLRGGDPQEKAVKLSEVTFFI